MFYVFFIFFWIQFLALKNCFFSIFSFSKPSFSIIKFGPSARPSVCNGQLFLLRHVRIVLLLNIILHLSSFITNLLTILFRLLYMYNLIIQFWHSTGVNVRLSYSFRASRLWMMSSLFYLRSFSIIRVLTLYV